MVEIIAFFIFHRAQLYSKKTGHDYRSSSAIFDAGAWMVLIVMLNTVFLIIIAETFYESPVIDVNAWSYSLRYRLGLIFVLIGLFLFYILHKVYKTRFNELLDKFSKEDEVKLQERMRTNRWIYRVTWIGAISAIVCSMIGRWAVAGSIL